MTAHIPPGVTLQPHCEVAPVLSSLLVATLLHELAAAAVVGVAVVVLSDGTGATATGLLDVAPVEAELVRAKVKEKIYTQI